MTERAGGPAGRAERMIPGRRDVLRLAAGMAAGWGSARAETRMKRIGFVEAGSPQTSGGFLDALRDGLRPLGWSEGGNVAILARWAQGNNGRLPGLVDEVIWSGVDVLVTGAAPAAIAAGKVTRTIPVVLVGEPDPVAFGLADSLSRPGGNVTGISSLSQDLVDRQFELLLRTVPAMTHIAALAISQQAAAERRWRYVQRSADRLRLHLLELEAASPRAIERAFEVLQNSPSQGLWVAFDGSAVVDPAHVVALAAAARLPAIYPSRRFAAAGGLMAYGPDFADLFRRAAGFVDMILRGANPGALPFATPAKFDLVVNTRAAKALQLAVPPTILARADEVIERDIAAPLAAAAPTDEKGSWLASFDRTNN